jgi:hypothetical protein
MAKLISQVSQLQDQNRQLEAQLGLNPTMIDDGSSEKIEVEVTTGASTSSASSQPREVSVRLTVRAECDISEVLISLLARLKETGSFAVVSVDARQPSGALARASLTLRVTVRARPNTDTPCCQCTCHVRNYACLQYCGQNKIIGNV